MCRFEFSLLHSTKSPVTSYTDSGIYKTAAKSITSNQNVKASSLDESSTDGTFVNHNCNVTGYGLWILKEYIKVEHNTSFSSVHKTVIELLCYYKKRFCYNSHERFKQLS